MDTNELLLSVNEQQKVYSILRQKQSISAITHLKSTYIRLLLTEQEVCVG